MQEPAETRDSLPRKATITAAATALLLIGVKLAVGLATGTVTVLASAVDSLLDFLISTFNVYAVRTTERPSDETYNYGRGKIEGLSAFLEGLFILGSAVYILRSAILKLMEPDPLLEEELFWAMGAMGFSLIVTGCLVFYLARLSRRSRSLIIEADAAHYRTDLLTNGGILLALGLIEFTGWQWLDPVIAMGISFFVARAALPLVTKGVRMLLDRALDESIVDQIRGIASGHSDRVNGVHEIKTRRSGDTNFVEFHLVFDEDIRLREAHHIADEIEMRIRKLEMARWVINIHLDPVDDSHRDRKLAKSGSDD
jgi:cation diffusion facilitator family transporter